MVTKQNFVRLIWAVTAAIAVLLAGCQGPSQPKPTPEPTSIPPTTTPVSPTLAFVLQPSIEEIRAGQEVAIVVRIEPPQKVDLKWSVIGTSGGKVFPEAGVAVIYTAGSKPGTDIVTAEGTTAYGALIKQSTSFKVVPQAVTMAPTLTPTRPSGATPILTPSIPTPSPGLSIYAGEKLSAGYDMGHNMSAGPIPWVTDLRGSMQMSYPQGVAWGIVFITVGKPKDPPRPGKDFSTYKTLSIDLKGEKGGELVNIGIKDNTDPDDGSEDRITVQVTSDWKTYTFPLSEFATADLTRLYVVAEFVFEPGWPEETMYFRNIKYLP